MLKLVEPLYDIKIEVGTVIELTRQQKIDLILEMLQKIKYYEEDIQMLVSKEEYLCYI
jgi:hypothetical protein